MHPISFAVAAAFGLGGFVAGVIYSQVVRGFIAKDVAAVRLEVSTIRSEISTALSNLAKRI